MTGWDTVGLYCCCRKLKDVPVSRLSDLLNELNDPEKTLRELSATAERAGESISYSVIGNYLKGKHPEYPSSKTLKGLSAAFGVSFEVLENAVTFTGNDPYVPPKTADLLTATQRDAVNQIIRLLAEGNKNASPSTTQEPGTPGEADQDQKTPDYWGLAANRAPSHGKHISKQYDTLGEESQDT